MGKQALVRFVLVAVAGAMLAAACSDRVPAPETPTPTATPAAVRTPQPRSAATPSATPGHPPDSAPNAVALKVEPGAPFPLKTVLIIETGCWQCDGPTSGLERVYRRADGSWSREKLVDPELLGLSSGP